MTEELQAPITEQIETPVVEAPVEIVQEQKPDPKDLRAVIEHAQKEVDGRARDEHGRFIPQKEDKPQAAPSAAIETKSPQGAPAGTEIKALEAPATWKAEAKALFASLPPLAQAEVLRREKEVAQGFEAKAKESNEARAFREALEPVIGPHRQYLEQAGSVHQGIKNLLETSAYAATNPVQFIQWFAQQKGIDLSTMQAQPQGDQNPEVAQLRQMVTGLQGQLQQMVGETQQQHTRSIVSEIQAFADEKDTSGQSLRPHFESVRGEIHDLIPIIKGKNPDWSPRQIMQAAYERAVRINDEVFQKVTQETANKDRLAKEAADRAAKAKLAQKSLTGSSPVGETQRKASKGRTVRDDILAAMEEHGTESRV